ATSADELLHVVLELRDLLCRLLVESFEFLGLDFQYFNLASVLVASLAEVLALESNLRDELGLRFNRLVRSFNLRGRSFKSLGELQDLHTVLVRQLRLSVEELSELVRLLLQGLN